MAERTQITLPITGMTCANCVATVERNLKKEKGVQSASVNLASERATVEFDPAVTGLDTLIARVRRAATTWPPVKPNWPSAACRTTATPPAWRKLFWR